MNPAREEDQLASPSAFPGGGSESVSSSWCSCSWPCRRSGGRCPSAPAGSILWAASPITPFVPDFSRFPETTKVLAADGSELAALSGEDGRRQVVELEAVPEHVRRAVLAAEDADFYRHSGVNPLSIVRAVGSTALGRTQGGSTITQQLAKLNYTGSRRSVFRKFSEVFYASALEQRYSKDELLEPVPEPGLLRRRRLRHLRRRPHVLRRRSRPAHPGPGGHPGREDPGPEPARPPPGARRGRQAPRPGPAGHGQPRLARPGPSSTPPWPSR